MEIDDLLNEDMIKWVATSDSKEAQELKEIINKIKVDNEY